MIRSALRRLRRVWREAETDSEMHWNGYQAWRDRLTDMGMPVGQGIRVLEVGCGDRAQLSLLLAADGAGVTALDLEPVAIGLQRPMMWLRLSVSRGLRSAARAVVRDVFHTFRYWQRLAALAGRPLPLGRLEIVQGDAARLPFSDASFDVVVSSAVWGHLPDIAAATREVHRVLRPGGVAVIQIALFPALQGGHHAEWHSVEPDSTRSIRPWDHLYPDRRSFPTFLNELRESDYRRVMDAVFPGATWEDGELRGAMYLTPQRHGELGAYAERELLMAGVTAWLRRPGEQTSA